MITKYYYFCWTNVSDLYWWIIPFCHEIWQTSVTLLYCTTAKLAFPFLCSFVFFHPFLIVCLGALCYIHLLSCGFLLCNFALSHFPLIFLVLFLPPTLAYFFHGTGISVILTKGISGLNVSEGRYALTLTLSRRRVGKSSLIFADFLQCLNILRSAWNFSRLPHHTPCTL
jgi:hypothetical protein